MADEYPRYGREYVEGKVDALLRQVEALQSNMGQSLKDLKDEARQQELRLNGIIKESEQRAIARAVELTRSMEQQNVSFQNALREDRQQWINANDRMRQDLVAVVKTMEERQLAITKDLEEKYKQAQAQLQPIQRYVFMALGALAVIGGLIGFIQMLVKPWIEKITK